MEVPTMPDGNFTLYDIAHTFRRQAADLDRELALGGFSAVGYHDGQLLFTREAVEYLAALHPLPLPSAARVVEPAPTIEPIVPAFRPTHRAKAVTKPNRGTWRMNQSTEGSADDT
jgi:hypothetical protein